MAALLQQKVGGVRQRRGGRQGQPAVASTRQDREEGPQRRRGPARAERLRQQAVHLSEQAALFSTPPPAPAGVSGDALFLDASQPLPPTAPGLDSQGLPLAADPSLGWAGQEPCPGSAGAAPGQEGLPRPRPAAGGSVREWAERCQAIVRPFHEQHVAAGTWAGVAAPRRAMVAEWEGIFQAMTAQAAELKAQGAGELQGAAPPEGQQQAVSFPGDYLPVLAEWEAARAAFALSYPGTLLSTFLRLKAGIPASGAAGRGRRPRKLVA